MKTDLSAFPLRRCHARAGLHGRLSLTRRGTKLELGRRTPPVADRRGRHVHICPQHHQLPNSIDDADASPRWPIGSAIGGAWLSTASSPSATWPCLPGRQLIWLSTRLPRKETLLPNFYQVGVLSLPVVALDRHVHRHGAGGAELLSVPPDRTGNAAGRGDQHVAGPRVGTGAGRHDAGRPRRQRDGGRAGHDAGDRTDRRPDQHGGQLRSTTWSCRGSWPACC